MKTQTQVNPWWAALTVWDVENAVRRPFGRLLFRLLVT